MQPHTRKTARAIFPVRDPTGGRQRERPRPGAGDAARRQLEGRRPLRHENQAGQPAQAADGRGRGRAGAGARRLSVSEALRRSRDIYRPLYRHVTKFRGKSTQHNSRGSCNIIHMVMHVSPSFSPSWMLQRKPSWLGLHRVGAGLGGTQCNVLL